MMVAINYHCFTPPGLGGLLLGSRYSEQSLDKQSCSLTFPSQRAVTTEENFNE